jgi:hypothetical protein
MRARLRTDEKDKLNSNEMMVKLAELWKNLGEYDKKRYHDQAEKEKHRYLTELNDFYQNFPFEVIQNKTKKNHVKKPCSAYALYLKEMKIVIKSEKPDLKMADILKVVAERWKNLSDEHRVIYQKKAQIEKELTKAKMNEYANHQVEEPPKSKKDVLPKKHVQSQKRVQKALLKETVKSPTSTDAKIEANENNVCSIEEPSLVKQQVLNICFNSLNAGAPTTLSHIPMNNHHIPMNSNFHLNFHFNPNPTQIPIHTQNFPHPLYQQNYGAPKINNISYMNNDNIPQMNNNTNHINNNENKQFNVLDADIGINDISFFNPSFNKIQSQEIPINKFNSRDELGFNKDLSQIWNFCVEPRNQNSEMIDLMNFHSTNQEPKLDFVKREEDYFSSEDDDEYLPSTATNMSPTSNQSRTNRTQKFNSYLMSAMEPSDFIFDPLTLEDRPNEFALWKERLIL